ncbi:PAS domain S-box protein [Adhaeribacter swui]|uniref:histidine kinase n=1 Tax=Adhaeribacter swui TaxID=2086471 RepID=A0A7G7GCR9_9BACT|nr:PAS domain S-box protein [Adhaeribacter swui]QNF34953.1 PAS domain S-box protein [Adhaeribacter swui]
MADSGAFEIDGKFRALVENTSDTIVIADDLNNIIFSNNKIFSTFGYLPEEVLQKPLTILLPPPYRDIYAIEFSRFIKNYKAKAFNPITEVLGYCKDGTIIPAEISLAVWEEANGHVYSSVIIRDVSERKKWEDNLEKERDFLQAILDNAEDSIIGCDENGEITYFNHSARNKKLISAQPDRKKNWFNHYQFYYPGNDQPIPLHDTPLFRALRGEEVKNQEILVKAEDNTCFVLLANGRQIVSKNGVVRGAVIVIQDITMRRENRKNLLDKNRELSQAYSDLKEAEQKLKEANTLLESRVAARTEELLAKNQELNLTNAALQKLNINLDNFIHIASHDLKVPITNLEALLKILESSIGNTNEDALEILEKIEISVARLKKSVKAVGEVAKVQKQLEYQTEHIDLPELVIEITESIAEQLNDVQLSYDFSACDTIYFSYVNLKSIVSNLITNAIKYRSPDRAPMIKIYTERVADGVTLAIQDNGLGIDLNKNGNKLFSMFSRLHDHVEGSGIGLYIIKRIIENSGGYITVSSELGVGSTFTVFFLNQV